MHELAHLRGIGGGGGSNGLNWRIGQYEPYLLREAVALSAQDSVNNAQNFAFYFAGESLFYFSLVSFFPRGADVCNAIANVAGCTKWPKDIVHDEGRHLLGLETLLNVSLATKPVEFFETDVPSF